MIIQLITFSNSDTFDQKSYLVYVEPNMKTVQQLESKICSLFPKIAKVRLYQNDFRIPNRQCIQILDRTTVYRCKIQVEQENQYNKKPASIDQESFQQELKVLRNKSIKHTVGDNQKKYDSKPKSNQIQPQSSSESSDSPQVIRQNKPRRRVSYRLEQQQQKNKTKINHSLQEYIGGQINYYFSDKNYYTDRLLQSQAQIDDQKFINLDLFLTFPKIKKVLTDFGKLIRFVGMYDNNNIHYELDTTGTRIRKKQLL